MAGPTSIVLVRTRAASFEVREMSTPTSELSAIERKRIVSLAEAARLRGQSIDSIRRNDQDKIIQLSPRRQGMRIEDALLLPPN